MINKTQLLVTRGDTAEPMKSRAVDQAFVFFEEISLQMDGKHDNAAKTGNAPPEGKQSYIQAASKTQHQPFYRKIDYNLAVVEHIDPPHQKQRLRQDIYGERPRMVA